MTTSSSLWVVVGRMVARTVALGCALVVASIPAVAQDRFQVEEATIDDIQEAIQQGTTTCVEVVQAYVDRARAYNGMCTQLVTEDGASITPGTGTVPPSPTPLMPSGFLVHAVSS